MLGFRHETGDLWDVHVVELTYDMNNTREFPYVAHPSDSWSNF